MNLDSAIHAVEAATMVGGLAVLTRHVFSEQIDSLHPRTKRIRVDLEHVASGATMSLLPLSSFAYLTNPPHDLMNLIMGFCVSSYLLFCLEWEKYQAKIKGGLPAQDELLSDLLGTAIGISVFQYLR